MESSTLTLTSFSGEVEKIAREARKEQTVLGGVAVGSAVAGGLTYFPGGKQVPVPTGPVAIYYTDVKRGAGHFAQATALAEAFRRKGQQVRLIDFDNEFGDKKLLDAYNKSFDEFLSGRKPWILHLTTHLNFYRSVLADPKFEEAMSRGDRVVLANVGLQPWVGRHTPAFVLHTDPHPWGIGDYAFRWGTRGHHHIASAAAAEALKRQHPSIEPRLSVISDLPIKPLTFKKGALMEPGTFNITVSGGGLGLDTPQMAEHLLKAKLPKGTVIHAVAARSAENLKLLQALEERTAGLDVRVKAYGFSDLPSMMVEADLNVLRPHGTSITEATAVGKPFVLYLPEGARRMDVLNAWATARHTGQLVASGGALPRQVEAAVSGYDRYLAKVQPLAQKARSGADEAVEAVNKLQAFRMFPRTGPVWKAARIGLGLTAAASTGALAASLAKKDGHWRKLPVNWKGHDQQGQPVAGRTWVDLK